MAVEINEAQIASRQVVPITWDTTSLDGELVKLYCVNPDNGDVSESGLSANDGTGQVSYPLGYVGTTEITVLDNHGNTDFGVIEVGEGDEVTQPEPPTKPPLVDPGWGIDENEGVVVPSHPIVYPPEINPLG